MCIRQRGNKKRTTLCILLIIVLMMLMTGCPGLSDWDYADLPGDYVLAKVNSQDIQLCKPDGTSYKTQVDRYIISFCYYTRFIGLQRIPIERPYSEVVNIEELDKLDPEYYLIDSESDSIYGPWSMNEYYDQVKKYGISSMCEWIDTEPRPDGAK